MLPKKRMQIVANMFIRHTQVARILNRIERCHKITESTEPRCFFFTGDTGCGKTSAIERYMRDYPRQAEADGIRVPVLKSTISAIPTVKSVAMRLLEDLGDPLYHKGTTPAMSSRLYRLIKECGVELIIIDEFQHLIDTDSEKIIRGTANWLKELVYTTRIPVVLVGMPESKRILEENDQLKRRFSAQMELKPFEWDINENGEFRTFLRQVAEGLPFDKKTDLADQDMAFRMHIASGGKVSKVMLFVLTAVEIALKKGKEEITMKMLEKAYELEEGADLNPFDIKRTEAELKTAPPPDPPDGGNGPKKLRIKTRLSKR
jgi:Cdc6-like AAA superfamily ATPase